MPRTKQSVEFSALSRLYHEQPQLFQAFFQNLAQSFGFDAAAAPIGSLVCPHCKGTIEVCVSSAGGVAESGKQGRKASSPRGSVGPLLSRLARLKGRMVGDINQEFTKTLGSHAKTLTKDEYRHRKTEWLRSQIARLEKRGKKRVA